MLVGVTLVASGAILFFSDSKPSQKDITTAIERYFDSASLASCPKLFDVSVIKITRNNPMGSSDLYDVIVNLEIRPSEDVRVPTLEDIELARYAKLNKELSIDQKNKVIADKGKSAAVCNATRFELVFPYMKRLNPSAASAFLSGDVIAANGKVFGGVNQRFSLKTYEKWMFRTWFVSNPILSLRPLKRPLESYETQQISVIQF